MMNADFEIDSSKTPVSRARSSTLQVTKQLPTSTGTFVGGGREEYVFDSMLLPSARERTALRRLPPSRDGEISSVQREIVRRVPVGGLR
jgi:hypothetical protein